MDENNQHQDTNRANSFRERAKRYELGETLKLTSGPEVKVRRPSIASLIQQGKIPASLAAATIRFDTGRDVADKDVKRLYELRILVAQHALISPKLVANPNYDNDEIAITDLTDDDLSDIYQYIQVGLEELNRFRSQRERVHAGSDSPEISGN